MFSILFLSLLCFQSIDFIESESVVPFPFLPRTLLYDWSCKETGWTCKDCNTLQRCEGNTAKYEIKCRDQTTGQPFCSPKTNKCVANNEDCQGIVNEDFICPARGTYPHLLDCKQFHQCLSAGAKGIISTCLFNTVYDHKAKGCRTGTRCYTSIADCGDKHKIVVYSLDNSLYFVCRGVGVQPILQECGKNLYFNLNKMNCDYSCTQEGNFANPSDERKYYTCVKSGNIWQSIERTCDEDEKFDQTYGFCVPDENPTTKSTITTKKDGE